MLLHMYLGFCYGIFKIISGLQLHPIADLLLILLIPDLAVTTKRWHDRNKSAYWLALNIPLILGRLATPMTDSVSQEASGIETLMASIALLCGAWILLECGCLKGTDGMNRYGKPEN